MKKLSEMPFISISKENLMAASDMLDTEQKGELMEMIIDAILNDAYPTSEDRCVNGVYKQFMAVIERKAEGYAKRVANLDKVNQEKKKQTKTEQKEEEVSTYTPNAKIDEEDLEKIFKAEIKETDRDFGWRIRDVAKKTGLTQDFVQSQYYDYREKKMSNA